MTMTAVPVEEDLRKYLRSSLPERRRRTIRLTGTNLNVDGTAEPEKVFHFMGHGEAIASILPDAAIEADEADFEQSEANFSELLAQLDASDAESSQRQAVIAELRRAADADLSTLAEVVAAL
jgi:ABC-type Zn uptake system ZnuABC Zn-binding protein ZnuA